VVQTFETFRGVAYPWLCDQMGHLNTAKYVEMFDVAGFHLLHLLGLPAADQDFGWADVRQEIDYKAEVPLGALVVIRSGLLKAGGSSLRARHVMESADGGNTHAVMEVVTVRLDLHARRAAPLPREFRERAGELVMPDA
jgi:acyl-CoA thioester hydrolase